MTNDSNKKYSAVISILWIIPAIMLLVAMLPMPYGYYTFLRIMVGLASGFIAYVVYSETRDIGPWAVTYAFIALLFNPIAPIHLSREIWLPVDLFTSGVFCAFGIVLQQNKKL